MVPTTCPLTPMARLPGTLASLPLPPSAPASATRSIASPLEALGMLNFDLNGADDLSVDADGQVAGDAGFAAIAAVCPRQRHPQHCLALGGFGHGEFRSEWCRRPVR